MQGDGVTSHCERVVNTVTLLREKHLSEEYKTNLQQMFDGFLKHCPLLIPCGLILVEKTQPDDIRRYGLKIIQHVVKFRWNHLPLSVKSLLKKRVWMVLSAGTKSILQEETDIKHSLARIVMELAKHEWPRQWPELLLDLEELSRQANTQVELVMLILLMLVKDVVTNRKLPFCQRRPIKFVMKKGMRKILHMVVHVALQKNVEKYSTLKTDPTQQLTVQACHRVIVAALNTLAGYLEFISMHHIVGAKCKLLNILWPLLDVFELEMEASACLLVAFNRINNLRNHLPLLFSFQNVIKQYLSPAKTTDEETLTEYQYFFLKRRCQLFCAVGRQLCRTQDLQPLAENSSVFESYLNSLLDFTKHSSQLVSSITQTTWREFFSHDVLSRHPLLLAMLPKYLHATMTDLRKIYFSFNNDSPSCKYCHLDFDDVEDFNEFLAAFFGEQRKVIEVACRLDHRMCYQIAFDCLKSQLCASLDPEPFMSLVADGLCYTPNPSFVHLEGLAFFFDVVIRHMLQVLNKEDIPLDDGIELLQLVLNFKTSDAFVLTCIATILSTLIHFLSSEIDEYLIQVFLKLLEIIAAIEAPKLQALKMGRRCACSCILNLCRDKCQLILPDFELLYEQVSQLLWNEQLLLTQMEKNNLMEAMIILTNQYKDYEGQKLFLECFMDPVASSCLSENMQRLLHSTEAFMHYACASRQITDAVVESYKDLNRSKIIDCTFTILGVLRWTRWPTDLEEAKAGGFVIGFTPNCKPIYRNPCTELVLKLLNNVLVLIWIQHQLYLPEVLSKNNFAETLDLMKVENRSILDLPQLLMDIYDPSQYKTELEKMQGFFCTLYETCVCILGHAASFIKQDFYTVNDLLSHLSRFALVNLETIPDYRLLFMVRCFLKPLVLNCPPEYCETLLPPIVGPVLTSLYVRLSDKWNVINQKHIAIPGCTAAEKTKSPNIDKKQLKLLTGEAMEFITACCVYSENADYSVAAAESVADKSVGDEIAMEIPLPTELTPLGMCLMKETITRSTLLVTSFSSLVWNDQFTHCKNPCHLCWLLLQQVVLKPSFENAVTYCFIKVLEGLEMHKDHEYRMNALYDLAFQIYESLRLTSLLLRRVIRNRYTCAKDAFMTFDEKVHAPINENPDVKQLFRCLLQDCIVKTSVEGVDGNITVKEPNNAPSNKTAL